ncbi:cell division protein ZapA [Ruminococcaceae bacterium OttesenSCG-928-L11]|nr:cell division protein ZapA [Ruminococcaceae bacterium OttesenSCG-928-L11]
MSGEVNKVTVQIYGVKYNLTTTEKVTYVEGLARDIDKTVHDLMGIGGMSVTHALLLTALSAKDEARKIDEGTDNLRRQITEYADEMSKLRAELNETRKELTKRKESDEKSVVTKRNGQVTLLPEEEPEE